MAGSSVKHDVPWIPAVNHAGDSTCSSSRIKAYAWRLTGLSVTLTSTRLPAGNGPLFIFSCYPVVSLSWFTPSAAVPTDSTLSSCFLPSRLTCEPHPTLLCAPVHSTHLRNLFHEYVSEHTHLKYGTQAWRQQVNLLAANKQKAQLSTEAPVPYSGQCHAISLTLGKMGSGYMSYLLM